MIFRSRHFLLFILLLPCVFNASGQERNLSLLFIGDVMQHKDQITNAFDPKSGKYVYDTFKYIKDEISKADVAIANLEFTLGGPPYSGYPQFSAPDEIAVALNDAGVDVLVTANNHSCDRRKKGIVRTVDMLDSLDFPHTGTYKNLEDKVDNFPLIIEKNGFRIALLNYTYGTNGIPVPKGTIVDLIDKDAIKQDLKLAQSYGVDKSLVFLHWGLEYQRNPSSEQVSLANFCLESGADFVIGSHPHVLQKMENRFDVKKKDDEVVVYSLGNFVSHQRSRNRDGGAMVQLNLVGDDKRIWVESVGYYLTWVHNPQLGNKEDFFVLPAAQYEANQSFLDDFSYQKMITFIKDSRELFRRQNVNVHEYKYDQKSGLWTF